MKPVPVCLCCYFVLYADGKEVVKQWREHEEI